jgi:hypothetical protein
MITELDEQQEQHNDDRATLVWSLLVSGFANLMGWMVLAWVIAMRTHAMAAQNQTLETFVVTSSALHIAQHTQPVPQQPNQQAVAQQQQPKPEHAAHHAVIPLPQAQPTELARITPRGTPQPRSAPKKQQEGTLAEKLAQQQVAFEHEAAQLNAQRAPLSIATIDPNQEPASQQHFQMNMSGIPGVPHQGEGFITPKQGWRQQGLDCYPGGSYSYQYPDGQTEDGDIPWTFCYPSNADPFHGHHLLPMPLPMRGYRLPSGTELQPQARQAYEIYLSLTGQSTPQ